MKTEGLFTYFIDGEKKDYNEVASLITEGMTCTVDGLNVNYTSPKKVLSSGVEGLLKMAEEHQAINGRVDNEFPFDTLNKPFWYNLLSNGMERGKIITHSKTDSTRHKATSENSHKEGIKETEGKLYYELSWEFIEEMAKRMANNKTDKYPLFNWKKDINIEDLKQAINRHHIEVMKGNYKDENEVLGHIVSYACNSMMLWEQLKEK